MAAREPLPDDRFAVRAAFELIVGIENEGHSAGHAGAEVRADGAEDHRGAAGHIFAAIGAAALDDDLRARVADRETLARPTRREQGRSEEHTSELQYLMRISYAAFC